MSRNMSRMKKEKKLFIISKLRNFMKTFCPPMNSELNWNGILAMYVKTIDLKRSRNGCAAQNVRGSRTVNVDVQCLAPKDTTCRKEKRLSKTPQDYYFTLGYLVGFC